MAEIPLFLTWISYCPLTEGESVRSGMSSLDVESVTLTGYLKKTRIIFEEVGNFVSPSYLDSAQ